ncbi:hypothetical protein IVB36_22730, partial [Bradyrhizobium sp. 35]|uniref:hypothetical protein n=1 Tax=Bradyrhizobium sp. 35 TaxID=2782670 RepID=UPI001FF71781
LETASIAHGGDQGCCCHRSDAFDFAEPLALLTRPEDFPYPPVIGCNAGIKLGQLLLQFPHERLEHLTEAVIDVSYDDREATPQLRDVTGNDNPMLGIASTGLGFKQMRSRKSLRMQAPNYWTRDGDHLRLATPLSIPASENDQLREKDGA